MLMVYARIAAGLDWVVRVAGLQVNDVEVEERAADYKNRIMVREIGGFGVWLYGYDGMIKLSVGRVMFRLVAVLCSLAVL